MIYLDSLLEKKDHLIKKVPSLTPTQKDEIIAHFQKFPHKESEIDWNKLNQLTYDDFKKVMDQESNSQRKKLVRDRGISGMKEGEDYLDLSDEDEDYLAYIPLSYEASKLIASKYVGGCEGKWCTAYQKTPNYWNQYTGDEGVVLIYFIFHNEISLDNAITKAAVAVYPSGETEIFNAEDERRSYLDFNAMTGIDIDKFLNLNDFEIDNARERLYLPTSEKLRLFAESILEGSPSDQYEDVVREAVSGSIPYYNSWDFNKDYDLFIKVSERSFDYSQDIVDEISDFKNPSYGLYVAGPEGASLYNSLMGNIRGINVESRITFDNQSKRLIDKLTAKNAHKWGGENYFSIDDLPMWNDINYWVSEQPDRKEAFLFVDSVLMESATQALKYAVNENDKELYGRYLETLSRYGTVTDPGEGEIMIPSTRFARILAENADNLDSDNHLPYETFIGDDLKIFESEEEWNSTLDQASEYFNEEFRETFKYRMYQMFESRDVRSLASLFERKPKTILGR